ncbi:MAG: methyltransferase domain-containing protein [Planctomycetes bacterium]|jgi:ubiquinone/menaquinone biosynthesis C-methylase UbiE|nr:methyltransferase domain-containing protein [Planctomycetota bacterium]
MAARNPQAEQMADESMVRNLAAQAKAIWPQERPLFESYALKSRARILDLACGTGEITERLADLFPDAELLGLDVEPAHLERARKRCERFEKRVHFEVGDAFALKLPRASFDLTVCRHLFQAVPQPQLIIEQMKRVLKPKGRIHLIVEDYSLMLFAPTRGHCDEFFARGPLAYGKATGTDLRIGRKTPAMLFELGFSDVRCNFIVIDTLRVKRAVFAGIWKAWRDGYSDTIARHTGQTRRKVWRGWNDMIAAIENPRGYGVWLLPCVSGRK